MVRRTYEVCDFDFLRHDFRWSADRVWRGYPTVASVCCALTSAPSSPSASQTAGSEIVISNMSYTVPPSVSPGQQLTIVNNDSANHTVTADENNLFDVRVSGGGGSSSFTAPTTPGTYPFHCKYHANMHGVLTVK